MLNNLQLLRAFAALNVVLFHTLSIGDESGFGVSALNFLGEWGANGIDIFFVLSGFIMVYIADRRPRGTVEFLRNRAIRIVPIYWILTLVGVFAILASGDFRGAPVALEPIAASFLFLTRWTTMDMPILYVGWTLEWEMLFYFIFGVCLLLNTKKEQFLAAILFLSALVIIAGLDPIILEFGFGMIVAKLAKTHWAKGIAGSLTIIGAGLLVASIWITPDLPQPILWGLPSAILVLGLVNIRQREFKIGTLLGNASYSIYLLQVFTIPVFFKIVERVVPDMSHFVLAMACLGGTALAGILFHLWIEIPLHKRLTGTNRKKEIIHPRVRRITINGVFNSQPQKANVGK